MSLFAPDEYFSSVDKIDPRLLVERGFSVVLLDIDNTLVPRDTKIIPAEIKAWVLSLKTSGLRLCLLSNNWHQTVFAYARELDLPIVYKAMKPLPFGYLRAFGKVSRQKGERVVVIGDQIFTDVLGAHLVRQTGYLVLPQATKDLWYTHIFRKLERFVVGSLQPKD